MPTAYEIYQTYLKGPAALIRLFEQTLSTQAIYSNLPKGKEVLFLLTSACPTSEAKRAAARENSKKGTPANEESWMAYAQRLSSDHLLRH